MKAKTLMLSKRERGILCHLLQAAFRQKQVEFSWLVPDDYMIIYCMKLRGEKLFRVATVKAGKQQKTKPNLSFLFAPSQEGRECVRARVCVHITYVFSPTQQPIKCCVCDSLLTALQSLSQTGEDSTPSHAECVSRAVCVSGCMCVGICV